VRTLLSSLRGAFSFILFALNTVFWTLPLLLVHLIKVMIPARGWRAYWSRVQNGIGTAWISFNNWNLRLTNPARWDVEGVEGLSPDDWYLVLANHQSWVDILVLQRVLNRKVPFLKFFLKRELIWVPLLGVAWWLLDYPFLKRSPTAGRDLEAIEKAAMKFKITPVSVMNFPEGTRFRAEKHGKQRSPHAHLLKPKAGGTAFVLHAMGDHIRSIVNVTIAYPGGAREFWDFLCGRIEEIRVRVEVLPVTDELVTDSGPDLARR
jgi:1-acyl-sn-glycerol-3-phosphate acyltransferase